MKIASLKSSLDSPLNFVSIDSIMTSIDMGKGEVKHFLLKNIARSKALPGILIHKICRGVFNELFFRF